MSDAQSAGRFPVGYTYELYLPYTHVIEGEAKEHLTLIIHNLGRSVVLKDLPSGIPYWVAALKNYVDIYGHRFPVDIHVALVHLVYELLVTETTDLPFIVQLCNTLTALLVNQYDRLKGSLELPWEGIYKVYRNITKQVNTLPYSLLNDSLHQVSAIRTTIKLARKYFPSLATKEILSMWPLNYCPFMSDVMKGFAGEYLDLLPTAAPPEVGKATYMLWLQDFVTIWNSLSRHDIVTETFVLKRLSRLAWDTIGYIDWDPHLPLIFHWLRLSFCSVDWIERDYETWKGPRFIAAIFGATESSKKHFSSFIQDLTAYIDSFEKKWVKKADHLILSITICLYQRVLLEEMQTSGSLSALHHLGIAEAKRAGEWREDERQRLEVDRLPIPETSRLNEAEIHTFTQNVLNCLLAIIRKTDELKKSDVAQPSSVSVATLRYLHYLDPKYVAKETIHHLYDTDDNSRPLQGCIYTVKCFDAVLPEVAKPEYQSSIMSTVILKHVLRESLTLISANDLKKTRYTLQLIHTLCDNVTFGCKGKPMNGPDEFVHMYLIRCLEIVRSENAWTRVTFKQRTELPILHKFIAYTYDYMLNQSTAEIRQNGIDTLLAFILNNPMKNDVACDLLSRLCGAACTKQNEGVAASVFIPFTCVQFQQVAQPVEKMKETEGDTEAKKMDYQRKLCVYMMARTTVTNGKQLLPLKDDILSFLDNSKILESEPEIKILGEAVSNILGSLCGVYYTEQWNEITLQRNIAPSNKDFSTIPLTINWHVPNDDEIAFAQLIVNKFIPIMFKEWTPEVHSGGLYGILDELANCAELLRSVVMGVSCTAFWEMNQLPLYQSDVPFPLMSTAVGQSIPFKLKKKNFREGTTEKLVRLSKLFQESYLSEEQPAYEVFLRIINIYENLITSWALPSDLHEWCMQSFRIAPESEEDLLHRTRRYHLLKEIFADHNRRLHHQAFNVFTPSHVLIMKDLFSLSTWRGLEHSPSARKARDLLTYCFNHYPNSQRYVIPEIRSVLQLPKPLIFTILDTDFLFRTDNATLLEICTPVFRTLKTPINANIAYSARVGLAPSRGLGTFTIHRRVSNDAITRGKLLLQVSKSFQSAVPSEKEEKEGAKLFDNWNSVGFSAYQEVASTIATELFPTIDSRSNITAGLLFLRCMATSHAPLPEEAIRTILYSLLHNSQSIRRDTLVHLSFILKQIKHSYCKQSENVSEVEQIYKTSSNYLKAMSDSSFLKESFMWLFYSPPILPKDPVMWDGAFFVHHYSLCFKRFPSSIHKYAPLASPLERRDQIWHLFEKFFSKHSSELFMTLNRWEISYDNPSSYESSDMFAIATDQSEIFKALFQTFGLKLLSACEAGCDGQLPLQEGFVVSSFLAGAISAAKHWPHTDAASLSKYSLPLLKYFADSDIRRTEGVSHGNEEKQDVVFALSDLFDYILINRDPRSLYWYVHTFMWNVLKDDFSNVTQSQLDLACHILERCSFRMPEVYHMLRDKVLLFLPNSNKLDISKCVSLLLHLDTATSFGNENVQNAHPRASKAVFETLLTALKLAHRADCQVTDKQNSMSCQGNYENLLLMTSKFIRSSWENPADVVCKEWLQLSPFLVEGSEFPGDQKVKHECRAALKIFLSFNLRKDFTNCIAEVVYIIRTSMDLKNVALTSLMIDVLNGQLFKCKDYLEADPKLLESIKAIAVKLLMDLTPDMHHDAAKLLQSLLNLQLIEVDSYLAGILLSRLS